MRATRKLHRREIMPMPRASPLYHRLTLCPFSELASPESDSSMQDRNSLRTADL